MARTSKKEPITLKERENKSQKKRYFVGIYARLSVEGDERKKESIDTQLEIVKAFIKKQKDMIIFDCYIDLGKTGMNFEREGFKRMMKDIKMRKINCIIVKDLSRFGRNYIETGNYIEKIFPFMGVRFIAVTDCFDSVKISEPNEAFHVNLKNLMNEMYARDIAVKVKLGKKTKWEEGSYIGGVPPYGYRTEWMENKRCLLVEETTSNIVKKIFELFLSGKNIKEIVEWLYNNRVVRPAEYHKTGCIYCQKEDNLQQWSRGTVKKILKNPIYMGCLVQGQMNRKDNMIDREDYIEFQNCLIKENTHKAIIGKDLFLETARKFENPVIDCKKEEYSKAVPLEEDIFETVLYCGDCCSKMKRVTAVKKLSSKNKVRVYSYHCPKMDRIEKEKCVTKSISLGTLTKIVKKAIQQELLLSSISLEKIIESSNKETEKIKAEWNGQLVMLKKKINHLTKLESEQYLKYRMGEIDEESFKHRKEDYEKEKASFQKNYAAIIEKLKAVDLETVQKNHFLYHLVKSSNKIELTAEIIKILIHRIEIYSDHRIKIIFDFQRKDFLTRKEII